MTTLTRAEIEAMTPEQLRLAVAEYMGWEWFPSSNRLNWNVLLFTDGNLGAMKTDAETHFYNLPDYPCDIEAAMRILERLRGMKAWISISITPDGCTWDVRGIINEREPNEIRFIAHHEILPTAICRAALLAQVTS